MNYEEEYNKLKTKYDEIITLINKSGFNQRDVREQVNLLRENVFEIMVKPDRKIESVSTDKFINLFENCDELVMSCFRRSSDIMRVSRA